MPRPTSAAAAPHRVAAFSSWLLMPSMACPSAFTSGCRLLAAIVSAPISPMVASTVVAKRSASIRLITSMAPERINSAVAIPVRVLAASFRCQVFRALVNALKLPVIASSIAVSGVWSIFFRLAMAFAT